MEYCTTDRQRQFLALILQNKTIPEVAEELGISPRNTMALGSRIRATAKRHGYNPDSNIPGQALPVKGTSTLYGDDGNVKLTWVKTNASAQEMIDDAEQIILGMNDEITPAKPVPVPDFDDAEGVGAANLMNVHIVTDYHFAMLADGGTEDTTWNIEIAETMFVKWMTAAIKRAPIAKRGVLLNLGDIFHFDGMMPVTPMSGHVLDADATYHTMVRVVVRCLRHIVKVMLNKYPTVDIVSAVGNHDLTNSVWLRTLFATLYEDEPRVTVDMTSSPFGALEHGRTFLGYHHGHKAKIGQVDRILAGQYPELFGRTKHRYCLTGHLHSKAMSESQLMIVEQFATMAGTDAYSDEAGYRSQRSSEVITYHTRYGEVGRQRFTPQLIGDL